MSEPLTPKRIVVPRQDSCFDPRTLRVLPRGFCERPVLTVARELVGKYVVRDLDGTQLVGRIVETEAYRGPQDRAAHSHGGRRTARTEVMFGPAGLCYVFRIYGMHDHLNVVAGDVGQPHAVLIRALAPCLGLETMRRRRTSTSAQPISDRQLLSGPGKLTRALGISRELYGHPLDRPPLYLAEQPHDPKPKLTRSPRIGIDYAGSWASKPWRFSERDSPWVSIKPKV